MRVLLLGPRRPWLESYLLSFGDEVVRVEERLPAGSRAWSEVDMVVSYGYRHLIEASALERFGPRAVNLHISLLPHNRGADPNLWSFLEDTPKGVTIHVLDAGLDTGPVIAQREVIMSPDDTLATSYERLANDLETLFKETWPAIREGTATPRPQEPGGSSHGSADKKPYEHLLTTGWDTPVASLVGKAESTGRE